VVLLMLVLIQSCSNPTGTHHTKFDNDCDQACSRHMMAPHHSQQLPSRLPMLLPLVMVVMVRSVVVALQAGAAYLSYSRRGRRDCGAAWPSGGDSRSSCMAGRPLCAYACLQMQKRSLNLYAMNWSPPSLLGASWCMATTTCSRATS